MEEKERASTIPGRTLVFPGVTKERDISWSVTDVYFVAWGRSFVMLSIYCGQKKSCHIWLKIQDSVVTLVLKKDSLFLAGVYRS